MTSFAKYILVAACILLVGACDKMPENGDLDGQWQVTSLARNVSAEGDEAVYTPLPLPEKGLYWNFQLKLLMIYTPGALHNGHTAYTAARFTVRNDSLLVTDTYIHTMNSDSLLDESTTCLRGVGIDANREGFALRSLSDKHMELVSQHYRLLLRKY